MARNGEVNGFKLAPILLKMVWKNISSTTFDGFEIRKSFFLTGLTRQQTLQILESTTCLSQKLLFSTITQTWAKQFWVLTTRKRVTFEKIFWKRRIFFFSSTSFFSWNVFFFLTISLTNSIIFLPFILSSANAFNHFRLNCGVKAKSALLNDLSLKIH